MQKYASSDNAASCLIWGQNERMLLDGLAAGGTASASSAPFERFDAASAIVPGVG
jgi:hypothetical protein